MTPALRRTTAAAAALLLVGLAACAERPRPAAEAPAPAPTPTSETPPMPPNPDPASKAPESQAGSEVVTLGAGCFWCIEAVLQQIDGVIKVRSGYMGGTVPNPSYEQVCTGRTGHAEVVEVRFDPKRLSFRALLDHFWKLHDPTTLNRQGNDVGTQYRSAIFYSTEEQRREAIASKQALEEKKAYRSPIVTEITPAGPFYEAEDYHQDYYRLNKSQPYCRFVIAPKLEKLGLEK